jgi:hypothetical protein
VTVALAGQFTETRGRIAVSTRVEAVSLGLVGALCAALVATTWRTWGNLDGDTGYDFVAGTNVAHGQFPYSGFLYYYGPLPALVLGAVVRLGGAELGAFIGVGLVIAGALVAATYVLGRHFAGPVGGALAAAITAPVAFAPNLFGYVLPYTTGATLGLLAVMACLIALAHDRTALAGLALGLVALTKPEFEAAAVCASAAWLVARALRGAAWRRQAALLAAPAVLIPLCAYGAFLTSVSAHQLVFENLYPRHFLHDGGSAVLHARAPGTVHSFAALGGRLALYAAGAALLVGVARLASRPGAGGRITTIAIVVATGAAVAISADRPGLLRHALQFAYGWIPAGAAIAAAVLLVRARRLRAVRVGASKRDAQIAVTVALTVLAATGYAAFFLHSTFPQSASYAAPLAAVFLVVLHLGELGRARSAWQLGVLWLALLGAAGVGLTIGDANAKAATVHGPGGAVRTTAADAAAYRTALTWIERRTRSNEPILLAPQMSWLYTVAGRQNALREISLLPGVFPDAGSERAAVRRLTSADVRLAVIDMRPYKEYGAGSFGATFDRVLAGWIRRNFVRAAVVPPVGTTGPRLQIWVRRSS